MNGFEQGPAISRAALLEYFLEGARPRDAWLVGLELERLGRRRDGGGPLSYDGAGATVRAVLEALRERRGGAPVMEGEHLVGVDADWGTLSLEPGGQVEWSSRPAASLDDIERGLDEHLDALEAVGAELGVRWLDVALDPELPVEAMVWMPKARYVIMRDYLGRHGRLAHRMMTQTASIQCAFDYADHADWRRKFRAAALLAPAAVALFANSSRADGKPSGWHSYRQRIWQETDPDRCGLPAIVFEPSFDIEGWLDWVLDAPTIFRQRARGLVPTGGIPFRELMQRGGCDALRWEDWELHASTIFTEVRSYSYIEVRSADLLPRELALAVPALWTGLLYDERALDRALELGEPFDDVTRWREAMTVAGRDGLAGRVHGVALGEQARAAVEAALSGLSRGAPCAGERASGAGALERLVASIDRRSVS